MATREHVRKAIADAGDLDRLELFQAVNAAGEAVRREIDRVIEQLENHWHSPEPSTLRASTANLDAPIRDVNDRPILAGALAVGANYLLTADERAFPHGLGHRSLAFWHPDTFLTALFQHEPDLYIDVRLDLADIDPPGRLIPQAASGASGR